MHEYAHNAEFSGLMNNATGLQKKAKRNIKNIKRYPNSQVWISIKKNLKVFYYSIYFYYYL